MNKRDIMTTIPLLIVNAIAVTGQFIFWRAHTPTFPPIAALGFACALESISVFVAYHAHLAELSQDSSFRLRFGSYAAGITIGLLNGSHFTVNGRITAASVGMFILSASSPVLWAIHTRRQSRDDLKAKEQIEDKAVKLGVMRWILWPVDSFGVFRLAVWRGQTKPKLAIEEWEIERERTLSAPIAQSDRATLETARTKADAVKVALGELGATLAASEVAAWLRERGWDVTPAHIRKIRSEVSRNASVTGATVLALPSAGMKGTGNPGKEVMTSDDN